MASTTDRSSATPCTPSLVARQAALPIRSRERSPSFRQLHQRAAPAAARVLRQPRHIPPSALERCRCSDPHRVPPNRPEQTPTRRDRWHSLRLVGQQGRGHSDVRSPSRQVPETRSLPRPHEPPPSGRWSARHGWLLRRDHPAGPRSHANRVHPPGVHCAQASKPRHRQPLGDRTAGSKALPIPPCALVVAAK